MAWRLLSPLLCSWKNLGVWLRTKKSNKSYRKALHLSSFYLKALFCGWTHELRRYMRPAFKKCQHIEVTFETVCPRLNVWSVNYPFCEFFCITAYYIRSLKTWHIFLLYLRNTTYKYNAHSSSLITFKSALRLRLVLTK